MTEFGEFSDDNLPVPFEFGHRPWPRPWMSPFLDALSIAGSVTYACKAVGLARQSVYEWREKHSGFALGWKEALERIPENLEAFAIRYATEGVPIKTVRTKTIYQVGTEGDRVIMSVEETVEESVAMSPSLIKFALSRHDSNYGNERHEHRHLHAVRADGEIEHTHRLEIDRVPSDERVIELAKLYAEFGPPELPPGELPPGE